LVIVGEHGLGKSTLLANYLLKFYEREDEHESEHETPDKEVSPIRISNDKATTPPSPLPDSAKATYSSSPPRYATKPALRTSSSFSPLPHTFSPSKTPPTKSYVSSRYAKTTSSDSLTSSGHSETNDKKRKRVEGEVVIIPHFIGCSPTSANRYEILRRVVLKLQKELNILHFFSSPRFLPSPFFYIFSALLSPLFFVVDIFHFLFQYRRRFGTRFSTVLFSLFLFLYFIYIFFPSFLIIFRF
jgi:hypothetical protein